MSVDTVVIGHQAQRDNLKATTLRLLITDGLAEPQQPSWEWDPRRQLWCADWLRRRRRHGGLRFSRAGHWRDDALVRMAIRRRHLGLVLGASIAVHGATMLVSGDHSAVIPEAVLRKRELNA